MNVPFNDRILLVDDNPAVHEDFRRILLAPAPAAPALAPTSAISFALTSAFQGKEALENVTNAVAIGQPYAMAFVDARMPPGWDGSETIERIWQVDRAIQIVICTAYSDCVWDKMLARLGVNDSLLILKKPFEDLEVLQLAYVLTRKWHVAEEARIRLEKIGSATANEQRATESIRSEVAASSTDPAVN